MIDGYDFAYAALVRSIEWSLKQPQSWWDGEGLRVRWDVQILREPQPVVVAGP